MGGGNPSADLLIVGQSPGRSEVQQGLNFVGQSGRLLDATLADVGGKREDCWTTNLTLCTPLKAGPPPPKAIEACAVRLRKEIIKVDPEVILTVGTVAVQGILGTKKKITALEGGCYRTERFAALVIPTYHPAAVLHGAEGFYPDIHDSFRKAVAISRGDYKAPDLDHNPNMIWCQTPEEIRYALEKLTEMARTGGLLRWALDTETDALNFQRDPLLQIGIYDGTTSWCLEYKGRQRIETKDRSPKAAKWEKTELPGWPEDCITAFCGLMDRENIEWVLHNESFDFQYIEHNFGMVPRRSIDTMCLALGTTEQGNRVGLKKLARTWFNAPDYDHVLAEWFLTKKRDTRRYSNVPRRILAKYLAYDVYYTWHLVPILQKEVEREGTSSLVKELLEPCQRMFARWEATGIKIDQPYVKELEKIWQPKIDEAAKEIVLFGRKHGFDAHNCIKKPKKGNPDLNPASPKQLAHLLYDVLRMPPTRGQAGPRTTGKEFLEANPHHEITPLLELWRTLSKMMSTYVRGVDKLVWADGRVHPDILLFGTRTGRLAIQKPAMQTIPVEKRLRCDFSSLRKLFIAPEGSVIAEVDYKTLEMRVAWHLSEDPVLGDSLMQKDFHTATASKIFGIPMTEVTKEQRHASKFVSFGIIYGRQAFSLAKGELNCSIREAQDFIDRFFKLYGRFHQWWLDTQRKAFEDQYLVTPTGRKRRWPLITPKNAKEVRNQAVNFPVQSFASDINLMAGLRLDPVVRERNWGAPLIAVHDSILFELKKATLSEALPYICKVMTTPEFKTYATFEVDVEVGPSWGEVAELLPPYRLQRV